jgi:tRNA pseudouridine55 synthase
MKRCRTTGTTQGCSLRDGEKAVDGILNINKALGMTSHDVVAQIRRLLKQRRVGHTGTLDPAASGVLPICVGQATRVAEYLSESGKAYEAKITFGAVTDTYDTEGEVLRRGDTSHLTLDRIQEALLHFLGAQQQMPPRYSAIKIQGQPAYKLARAGTELTMEARQIEIHALDVRGWEAPQLTLAVSCSKGTYIRSLAYDLGEYLGCGAHLSGLIRTRSGPFVLSDSITLEQLADAIAQGPETVANYLFPADYALQNHPALYLNEEQAQRVLHGNAFHDQPPITGPTEPQDQPEIGRVYGPDGRFLAIAHWNSTTQQWQPKKVLVG